MLVYITKYALSAGIQKAEGEIMRKEYGTIFYGRIQGPGYNTEQSYREIDFYIDLPSAIADADRRRLAQIEKHKKSIVNLEVKTFKIPE